MLYELLGVVRAGKVEVVKDIVRTAGTIVLQNGGVVRGVSNWGETLLPKRIRKFQAPYDIGHYFLIRFDSNARTQQTVMSTLALDPRMLRYSVCKIGSRLEEIADVPGQAKYFT